MNMQLIIMDRSGDTRQTFDTTNATELTAAEDRFKELTGSGFRAAKLSDDGSPGQLLKSFDPTAERVLFIPALQGG